MSVHNIYPQFSDETVERWRKTTVYAVAGTRLDPYDPKSRISFLLQSKESAFNYDTKTITFDPETDVIELYSDQEVKYFRAMNKPLIESGKLALYNEKPRELDTSNALSDTEIEEIAQINNILKFRAKLQTITSPITLKRILDLLPDTRARVFEKAVYTRMTEVE